MSQSNINSLTLNIQTSKLIVVVYWGENARCVFAHNSHSFGHSDIKLGGQIENAKM